MIVLKRYSITTLVLFFLLVTTVAHAQTKVVDRNFNTWWTNINRYDLSQKWYLSSELHFRRTDGLEQWQQFLFRPALNFELNDQVNLTVGYTYILSYPYGEQPIPIKTPENNFWEEVTLKHKSNQVSFSHRYRLEHRFIGDVVTDDEGEHKIEDHFYAQRFRYRFTGSFPLALDGKFFGKWFDEIWIDLDENDLMPQSLNQNWLYAGLGYQLSNRGDIEMGYMHQLIRKGDGVHYESNPTLQFTIVYRFGKSNN